MSRGRWWAVLLVVAACVAAGGLGFWQGLRHGREDAGHAPGGASAPAQKSPTAVSVLKLALQETQEQGEFSGSVQSRKVVQVSAEILARIESIAVRSNDAVTNGQVLITLDNKLIETRLRQAEESVGAAEAMVRQAEANVRGQEAARDEAQKDFTRYEETHKAGAASLQQLQQAEARLKGAEAAVQAAGEQAAAARKQVEAARQHVREAQEMLSKAVIRSPMDAVVVDRLAEPGDLAAPGRALLTLQSATDLRFEAPITEACARMIKDGDEVRVKIDAAGLELGTRVREIVPAVDPQSRSFLVRAALPAQPGLRPGMFGRLQFTCGLRPSLRLPAGAAFSRGQLDLVFVVEGGHARLRLVKLGRHTDGQVEVLSGLAAGEEVVLDPPPTLGDGDPVTPTLSTGTRR
jgi:multidrug efflux pump subunit AcrA (membrane-fusion protein)